MNREPIFLSTEQEQELRLFKKNGVKSAALVRRARVILLLNRTGSKCPVRIGRISVWVELSRQAIYDIWDDFLKAQSIKEFLTRKVRATPPVAPKITGDVQAHIIALACSAPPEGCARWTVKLLAEKSVELQYVDSISGMSVCSLLKKRNISLT